MDLQQNHVPPVYFRLLVDLMQQWGVGSEALLAGTGITESALHDPTSLLSLEQELTVYERAEQVSPHADWALRLGQTTSISAHGVCGYAVMTSATLRQALQLLVRFFTLVGCPAGTQLREHGNGDYEIRAVEIVQRPAVHRAVIEEFFSSANTALSTITGGSFRPQSLLFDYPAPAHLSAYSEVFNCPLSFDAPYSAIVVDSEDLDFRLPTWDPVTLQACEQQCEQMLMQLSGTQGFVDEVRKAVLLLPCDRRGAEQVAERMHMGTRNLRRRLEREGTSFQKVLDEVRSELAQHYLAQTQLRVEEVASLLGFAEPSNFRRAFRKWTGHSPSEYRKKA